MFRCYRHSFCWLKLLLCSLALPQFCLYLGTQKSERRMKRLIWKICDFSSNAYEQDTDRINFSGVLYNCLITQRFPFDFCSSVSFLVKQHLTSATSKVWTSFLPGASVGYVYPEDLVWWKWTSVWWKWNYSGNQITLKIPNYVGEKWQIEPLTNLETTFCLCLSQTQNFVIWKFLLLKSSKMLTVTVDTAAVLSYSYFVISNSIFFDLNFQISESCSLVYSFITLAFSFLSAKVKFLPASVFYIIYITCCSFVTDLYTCGHIVQSVTAKLIFLTHCDLLSIPLALS